MRDEQARRRATESLREDHPDDGIERWAVWAAALMLGCIAVAAIFYAWGMT